MSIEVLERKETTKTSAAPFKPGLWTKEINVRNFMQHNYEPYYGDESFLAGPTKRTLVKSAPYESGMDPIGDTRARFSVNFYVVAILFIVFDVETVFLLPWAVVMREVGLAGFAAAGMFVFILTVGLIYEWKKGALEWD